MTTIRDRLPALESYLAETVGAPARVAAARPLTGGASKDTWAIDLDIDGGPERGRHALILRRDEGGEIHDEALSRAQEFALLRHAHAAGLVCVFEEVGDVHASRRLVSFRSLR